MWAFQWPTMPLTIEARDCVKGVSFWALFDFSWNRIEQEKVDYFELISRVDFR
jgi:hypothetical protein